jgi:outer membrane protein assembly factor BamD (BamD/ComL family)
LSLYKKIKLEIEKDDIASAKSDINKFLIRYPDHESAKEIQQLEEQLAQK